MGMLLKIMTKNVMKLSVISTRDSFLRSFTIGFPIIGFLEKEADIDTDPLDKTDLAVLMDRFIDVEITKRLITETTEDEHKITKYIIMINLLRSVLVEISRQYVITSLHTSNTFHAIWKYLRNTSLRINTTMAKADSR